MAKVFLTLAGVDVTTDTSGGTRIDFGTNADGNSGYIVLNGVLTAIYPQ